MQSGAAPAQPQKPDRAEELRKSIDVEKKKIPPLIDNIKRQRHRLAYKLAEKDAVSKLAAISQDRTKDIGYLRRRKERLEFRIATEAFTLEAEKDLIRKKNAIEEELNKALKSYRLRKKAGFVEKDIEFLKGSIDALEKQVDEVDKKLDELYSELRRINGQQRRRPRPERKDTPAPKHAEISLADIATIKDKTKESGKSNGA